MQVCQQVFLIATVIGTEDDLIGFADPIVGDVEEVHDLIEQQLFAFGHRDVLLDHHHTVGLLAGGWPIVEFGHLLRLQPPVLKLPSHHHRLLDVVRSLAWLGRHRVAGWTL